MCDLNFISHVTQYNTMNRLEIVHKLMDAIRKSDDGVKAICNSTDVKDELRRAVVGGDTGRVKEILKRIVFPEHNAEIDVLGLFSALEPDEFGDTLLHHAARVGNEEVIPLLLSAGIGIDVQNNCGCTPLQSALLSGQYATARVLVVEGASTHTHSAGERSLLDSSNVPATWKLILGGTLDAEEVIILLMRNHNDVLKLMWDKMEQDCACLQMRSMQRYRPVIEFPEDCAELERISMGYFDDALKYLGREAMMDAICIQLYGIVNPNCSTMIPLEARLA